MLWFCIRTIVYALFLLSTIRDIDTGIHVPALSTYLLITFTVIDIFLFIYFLHYITRSVKCDTIIGRIFMETKHSLEKKCNREKAVGKSYLAEEGLKIKVTISGIYVGFQKEKLLRLCEKENFVIHLFILQALLF